MIRATAPGKVVLWGEYAVLTGAPALVMAVDRYAECSIGTDGGEAWRCSTPGFQACAGPLLREQLLAASPPEDTGWRLAWHVLQSFDSSALASGGDVCFDTRAFQENGRKLGIGSSAALCTAICGALGRLLGQSADYAMAAGAHRRFQGGSGSGIDVAAAWYGGVLRFQRPPDSRAPGGARPWTLAPDLNPTFVFAGESASTTGHLRRLRHWLDDGGGAELDALSAASAAVFSAGDPGSALTDYVDALWELDQAAGLDIFSAPHRCLRRLAFDAGVVYKPCGAGGGDIGAAFTPDTAAAQRFARLAADNGFLPIALETASHGLEVTG